MALSASLPPAPMTRPHSRSTAAGSGRNVNTTDIATAVNEPSGKGGRSASASRTCAPGGALSRKAHQLGAVVDPGGRRAAGQRVAKQQAAAAADLRQAVFRPQGIADRLHITIRTERNHVANILAKLGCTPSRRP